MLEKSVAFDVLKHSLELIKGFQLKKTHSANVYEFCVEERKYVLFHRHKNEKGSLMVHFSPDALERFEIQAGDGAAVLGYTICYVNPNSKKEEMILLAATLSNIWNQLSNPYNSAVIRGEKTNNIIIKFDSYSLSIIERENDLLTARFCI